MWVLSLSLGVLSLLTPTNACGGHDHSLHRRAFPSTELQRPARPLEWGDLNFIHTTDSHGWLLGHQKTSFPEPNYSGDLGDFSSFVSHMKALAIEKDVDLLLIDSGDLHDGTGLSDGFPVGGVDAHDSNEFLKRLPYDIMAIGNHELYIYENTLDMYTNFAPALNGRYLSSNVNITTVDANNSTIDVPVGERFAKFETRKGKKVTAFGVLFDFTGNDVNTTVQKVEDMVKEEWFLEAIQEEPDFFLLVGHMPVARDNWPLVFNAVRAVHPSTPIFIFGGHTHIRDCVQLDDRSMSLESGRYMETIGWMSANLSYSDNDNITFSRRYLDQNRVTYEYHSEQSNYTFDTPEGLSITQGLLDLFERFNLSSEFGVAPEDFTISQVPYPSNTSLLSLFAAEVMPYALTRSRANVSDNATQNPFFMIANSGILRFDIYQGPFDRNDQFTASPFLDGFNFISGVETGVALEVLNQLNIEGEARKIRRRDIFGDLDLEVRGMDVGDVLKKREEELYRRGDVRKRYMDWLADMNARHFARRDADNLTLGYVTTDSCPGVGDDVIHAPLASFDIPDFISSDTPSSDNSTLIDFVFVDFIQDQFLDILNGVQAQSGSDTAKQWADSDVGRYSSLFSNEIIGVYAEGNWN